MYMVKYFRVMDEAYTEEGLTLDQKVINVLIPIMKEEIEKGASIREVASIMSRSVFELELEMILNNTGK